MFGVKPWRAVVGWLLWAGMIPFSQALQFEVQSGPAERFQQVVSCPLTEVQASAAEGHRLVELSDGTPIGSLPFTVDRSGSSPVLVWLLSGITDSGQTRLFAFEKAAAGLTEPAADASDLSVNCTDTDIEITNTYYSLAIPRKGGGGFPRKFVFRLSGNSDPELHFLDRIYRKETRKQFLGERDDNASAQVLLSSPLRVVVESRFSYVRGNEPAPGSPRAVYRYTFTPYSPVIEVAAVFEKDDDEQWNELHFLHVSRDKYHYTGFVTGPPAAEIPMQEPGEKSRACGGKWAVMTTDSDAVGVGFSGVQCWDASDEFVYYVSRTRPQWSERRKEMTGGIYAGPAAADLGWYERWLGDNRQPTVHLSDVETQVPGNEGPVTGAFEFVNDAMRIVFADADAGYNCLAIENLLSASRTRFVNTRPGIPGFWKADFRPPFQVSAEGEESSEQATVSVSNLAPGVLGATYSENGPEQVLTFTWRELDIAEEKGVLDVTVRVVLPAGSAASRWTIEMDNRSRYYGLWQVHFPYLATVCPRGTADVLQPRGNWGGTLIRHSETALNAAYPSAACPVQFMAFMRDRAGLYLAAHDDGARAKELRITSEQDATFTTYAENMGVPGSDVAAPFPFIVGAYTGDWWEAARLYRRWTVQQTWTRRGWIRERTDFPELFRNMGLWMLLSGPVESVEPVMLRAAELCDVPIGVHWYNWHQIPFDNSYPEYFPTKEGFADAVRRLTARGQLVMPYINGRLWDQDIPSFPAEGRAGACRQPSQEVYTEVYGSGRKLSPMCPATTLWQDRVNEICRRLIEECGVNGIYLDQIGAARPRICFDAAHGHPLGGGRHWVDGYRVMLDRAKALAAAKGVTLTTENTAEPYMDNIDGYLAWVQRNDTDVPLLPAVYSGYTIYFTSPQDPKDDLTGFCMAQGRDFLWGCQLGWNAGWILEETHRAKLEFQLELCRIRRTAADFLVYGELLDEIRPTRPLPTVTASWFRRKEHSATLPAVQGTFWRSGAGHLGVFLVNYTDTAREICYTLSPDQWLGGGMKENTWLIARITGRGQAPWQLVEGDAVVRTDLLQPRECVAFSIQPAGAGNEVRETALREMSNADPVLAAAAGEYLFFRSLAAQGLRLSFPSRAQRLVRGEPAELTLTVTNTAAEIRRIRVTWPGCTESVTELAGGAEETLRHIFWPADTGIGINARGSFEVRLDGTPVKYTHVIEFELSDPLDVRIGTFASVRGGENVLLPVEVRNNSRTPRTGRLLLDIPQDWSVEPGRSCSLGVLAPGSHRSFLFRCTAPDCRQATRTTISAAVVQSSAAREILVEKSRPRAVATRPPTPIVIDGDLKEWSFPPAVALGPAEPDQVKITEHYSGASDCSASVWLAWDEKHLYVAAEVTDDIFFQEETGESLWQGDCLQFAFRENAPNRNPGFDGRERELGLSLTPGGALVFQWMPDRCPLPDVPVAVVRGEDKTRYETVIPWAVLGMPCPAVGRRLAWSMTVNDNDGHGFEGWVEWTPGICGGKDSSVFGWLELRP